MLSRVVGKLDSFGLIRLLRDPDALPRRPGRGHAGGEAGQPAHLAERAAIFERLAGLPPEQEAALVAALPALENLAEDLRAAVRRGRAERA